MNKRLEELYVETTGKEWTYEFDTHLAEKFSELIIQECTKLLRDCAKAYEGSESDSEYMTGLADSAEIIEKHFGLM